MVLSENISKYFNKQLNFEFESAYLYLAMSLHFERINLSGISSWMGLQAKEELNHAQIIIEYLLDNNCAIVLSSIKEPSAPSGSVTEIFETALLHEQKVTAALKKIAEESAAAKDFISFEFMKGFLQEQLEEERTLEKIIGKLKIADNHCGLLLIDSELKNSRQVKA